MPSRPRTHSEYNENKRHPRIGEYDCCYRRGSQEKRHARRSELCSTSQKNLAKVSSSWNGRDENNQAEDDNETPCPFLLRLPLPPPPCSRPPFSPTAIIFSLALPPYLSSSARVSLPWWSSAPVLFGVFGFVLFSLVSATLILLRVLPPCCANMKRRITMGDGRTGHTARTLAQAAYLVRFGFSDLGEQWTSGGRQGRRNR